MSKTKKNFKYKISGYSHGLRKELNESGILLPCSWRRYMMSLHYQDRKNLKQLRKIQGKKRRLFLKNKLTKTLEE